MAWIQPVCRQIDVISPINYKALDDISSPMLSIQEKVPSPTSNVGWKTIADQELSALLRSRCRLTQTTFSTTATHVCFENNLDQLYSYYHSLSKIKPHYTMALERSHLEVLYFTWYDSFKPWKKHSHTSIDSEKVAVVFNVGAVYSQMAAIENRGTADGLTKAFKAFQSAAAAFRYLKETFGEGESVDVSRGSVGMLETLMVAQAHECFFNQAVRAGKSPTNCSKAAKQFYAEACYHYSLYLHKNEEIGEEITRLQAGVNQLRSTKREIKGASSSLINVITKLEKNMNSRLEKARKENYSIYNMRVPATGSLSDLPTYVSKRPRPLESLAALDVMIQTVL